MEPFTFENIGNLRLGTKFDDQKRPQTTITFTASPTTPHERIAQLVELYRTQPALSITIQAPQMHLFSPKEEAAP